MDGELNDRADARGSAMDASIGARVSAKSAGPVSTVRGRIAQVKMRGYALGAILIGRVLCGSLATTQEKRPTAREVIAAIQEHVSVPWKTETVDTFKAGNPGERRTGVAVTVDASVD